MQKILTGQDARTKILEGATLLYDVVKQTLGPQGKNILFNFIEGKVRSTKDGVSVARQVSPDDPIMNTGCKLIREAAQKTADEAGDSTTTTTILAATIMRAANDLLNAGYSQVELKKGMELAAKKCIEWIKENATPINGDVELIRNIATISANNDTSIGDLIADAFSKIGSSGVINLEPNQLDKCEVEIMPGYSYNRGFINPYFVTNEVKAEAELINPYILFYDKNISKIADLLTVLQFVIAEQRPLLIIASNVEGEALGTLIANKLKNGLQICVAMAPEQGMKRKEIMEDMAIFTGGEVISEDKGSNLDQNNFKPEYLGQAGKVIVTKEKTNIILGAGNKEQITIRQEQIKATIAEAPSDFEKEYLRKRAGSIGQGCAILKIGASTEVEQGDKMDLADDAILAVRSAIEEGYLPGGGLGLIRCAQSLMKDASKAELIVYNALFEPLKQILLNNGLPEHTQAQNALKRLTGVHKNGTIDYILDKVKNSSYNYGYNAKTEQFGFLDKEGVIDAAKVVRCAIENAVSVAAIFICTEALISEIKDTK